MGVRLKTSWYYILLSLASEDRHGLAIARDVVERHGGTIELASGGGPGARFVIRLPR